MPHSFFVSDLHGSLLRYGHLLEKIREECPVAVFLGGDLLPHSMDLSWRADPGQKDFLVDFLIPKFQDLKTAMGSSYPRVFLILGNDDPRSNEDEILSGVDLGLWEYCHDRETRWDDFTVYGYSCIPPSPFMLKDWERYDVSRFVDPGCVSPEEGGRTSGPEGRELRYCTIESELENLTSGQDDPQKTILLSHCPPYDCRLDRAALDGQMVDHAPLDVHIGSIAIQRFIQTHQPLLTLHGHVHESRTLTGAWQEQFGRTHSFSAANDSEGLALIRFDPHNIDQATLEILGP